MYFFCFRSTGTGVPSPGPCRNGWPTTGHYLKVPTPCAPQTLQRSGGCAKESKTGVYLCLKRLQWLMSVCFVYTIDCIWYIHIITISIRFSLKPWEPTPHILVYFYRNIRNIQLQLHRYRHTTSWFKMPVRNLDFLNCFACVYLCICLLNVQITLCFGWQVMELLVHLNKRIKSRPKIQLPVETLLVQYQDPSAASFVTVRIKYLQPCF